MLGRRGPPADVADRRASGVRSPMKLKRSGKASRWHRGYLGVDGAALVEFAITAPVLVVLVLGVADYGLLMGDSAALEGATRAGAEVGKANPSVTGAQLQALNL